MSDGTDKKNSHKEKFITLSRKHVYAILYGAILRSLKILNLLWGAIVQNISTCSDFSDKVSDSYKCTRLDFYLSNSIFFVSKKLPDFIVQKYTPLETLFAAQFIL